MTDLGYRWYKLRALAGLDDVRIHDSYQRPLASAAKLDSSSQVAMRRLLKKCVFWIAVVAALPAYGIYRLSALFLDKEAAFQGTMAAYLLGQCKTDVWIHSLGPSQGSPVGCPNASVGAWCRLSPLQRPIVKTTWGTWTLLAPGVDNEFIVGDHVRVTSGCTWSGGRMSQARHRCRLALLIVTTLGWITPSAAFGQAQTEDRADVAPAWSVPRTPDGRPDLQGYWTTQTFTPFERPDHLAGKEFFTEEEAAALQAQLTADGVDPLARDAVNYDDDQAREQRLYQDNRDSSYVHYDNQIWLRTRVPKGLSSRRTSLVIDPPNGKVPPLTPKARERRAAARQRGRQGDPFDGHETRPLNERCYIWPHEGPPMLPPAYNDIHQIFQTPDYFVVYTELSNNSPRIIPLDGRPHIPDAIRRLTGDSRGRWEGDTLVVETTNLTSKTRFRGSSAALRVVERFTRVDDDTVRYEFTVDDPSTWASPWSVEIPMLKTEGPMFEYACHEGNHDIRHILEIHRNLDIQAASEDLPRH